jgi:hypothetical protein
MFAPIRTYADRNADLVPRRPGVYNDPHPTRRQRTNTMTTTDRCRYCGAAAHTASDACLVPDHRTEFQPPLGLASLWLWVLGILVLLGVLVALSAQLPTNW